MDDIIYYIIIAIFFTVLTTVVVFIICLKCCRRKPTKEITYKEKSSDVNKNETLHMECQDITPKGTEDIIPKGTTDYLTKYYEEIIQYSDVSPNTCSPNSRIKLGDYASVRRNFEVPGISLGLDPSSVRIIDSLPTDIRPSPIILDPPAPPDPPNLPV